MRRTPAGWPALGCGLGLRTQHYESILGRRPAEVDWFEAITENYIDSGGRPIRVLEEVRRHYPVALHGVSLSLGSADPLDEAYLRKLRLLADRIDPAIVSDHLCWTGVDGENLHDLLPMPYTPAAAAHLVGRIQHVQETLGRRILVENVSCYLTYAHSTLTEWDFLVEVARRSGCGILLDVNNVHVNAFNHGFDARQYLASIPAELVGQIHVAGHEHVDGKFLFDTHGRPVEAPVWELYRFALERFGPVSTLLERDTDVPPFGELAAELGKVRGYFETAVVGAAAG